MEFTRVNRGNYKQLLQEYTDKRYDLSTVEILDYIAALTNVINEQHNNLPNAIISLTNYDTTALINTSPILINKYLSEVLDITAMDNWDTFNLELFNNKFDMLDVNYLVNNKQDVNTEYKVDIKKNPNYSHTYINIKIATILMDNLKYNNVIKTLNLIIYLHEKLNKY